MNTNTLLLNLKSSL